MNKIYDAHSHFVPAVYLDALKKHNAVLEDGFPPPVWNADAHLKFMEEAGVSTALVSLSSPHPYWGDIGESKELCRAINEETADLAKKYPGKFKFNACLPLPDVDAAIAEAKYALDELGASGIKLASNSRGQYLGAPEMEPLFAYLNEKNAVINIHPHRPTPQQEGIFTAGAVSLFEFIADTTRAVMNLIANGCLERYENLKVIVPHCGSFLPNIYQRFQGIIAVLGSKGLMPNIDVKGNFSKLYFDTSGHPVPYLFDMLMQITTPDHVLYGSDFPYTPTPEIIGTQKKLKEKLDSEERYAGFSEQIFQSNFEKLFME